MKKAEIKQWKRLKLKYEKDLTLHEFKVKKLVFQTEKIKDFLSKGASASLYSPPRSPCFARYASSNPKKQPVTNLADVM